MAVLLSLNVGKPKDVGWQGRTVHTGIWKAPVDGPLMVRRLNIDGDGQGDLNGHGGEQRAVLVYQADSYRFWRAELGRDDLAYGQFGENFTVDGLADAEVFIGDRYRIGGAEFEVTQPRVTCFRVGMRLAEPRMPALLVAHHRPGFYLRSLSSDPASGRYRISVKREAHGLVSAYLRAGALVDVAAPRRDFVLGDSGGPVVLLSAGIGVTPVLAMLHGLAARASTREVWWIHTTRDARAQAFAAEADGLLAVLPNAHRRVFYTAETGRLTAETIATLGLPAGADAYICGPERFMTDMTAALTAAGITPDHIRTERFGALAAINPGIIDQARVAVHPPAGVPGTGPAVTFARSGLTVPWSGTRQSLLELAEACDVPTRWSCRSGVCHTCVTPIVSGRLHHDPPLLEDPPAGQALICCGRPDTDLVLDL